MTTPVDYNIYSPGRDCSSQLYVGIKISAYYNELYVLLYNELIEVIQNFIATIRVLIEQS